MPRYLTRGLQVFLDVIVLSVAYWAAFLFRFEFRIPVYWARVAAVDWPYVVLISYVGLMAFGVPRFSWRYVSIRETLRMVIAMLAATTLFVGLRFAMDNVTGALQFAVIPLSVIASYFVFGCVGLVGVRVARRVFGEIQERKLRQAGRERARVLLIGAGQAGVLVARELAARPDLALKPVGFLDDDERKLGSQISGLPVLGTTKQIGAIAETKRVERVLITIANAPGSVIRRITMACHEAGLDTKIIPGIYEIVGEHVNLSRIREVQVEDLLGREPVELDDNQLSAAIRGEVVMVTGAGGSIGGELCRQVCRYAPARLVLVERFENSLFEIHRELLAAHPGVAVEPRIADVTDPVRMEQVFTEFRPSFVFHAAAHKHVPMMEANPAEAVKNNIGGTRVVADLADRMGVARFVLVSTDKAVNPTSVMGATKRVAEIYTQALGQRSKTRFVTVRFGNVLGSNGSVIPIFKQQIAAGGPVTVTHPDMQRYFMTIPEASQLVLQAGAMGAGGEIFILDMGEPVKIVDLARDLIALSGFKPDEDIPIEFSGMRPGEKLFEQLSTDSEHADRTKHPKIFVGHIPASAYADAVSSTDGLLALAKSDEPAPIRTALAAAVPEYTGALPREAGALPREVAEPAREPERVEAAESPEMATRRTDPLGAPAIVVVP